MTWSSKMVACDPFEKKIIKFLLKKNFGNDVGFLRQLRSLRCAERRMTGTGYYLDFQMDDDARPVDHLNSELTEGFPTKLPPPRELIGFTLFIRDGYLGWLEGYTFGDVAWPTEPISTWLKLSLPERKAHSG